MSVVRSVGGSRGTKVLSTFTPDNAGGSFSMGEVNQVMRLPNDPIGVANVTFSGVVPGSEIHVYLPDGPGGSAGTEVAGIESCSANQVLSWPVYAAGSPNNNVHITIIKRGLAWRKFTYLSAIGNQTLPIFQITDLGYNNPA